MKKHITSITIGIRYDRTFRVMDVSGHVIDSIIRDSRSPFKKNYFTDFAQLNNGGKALRNMETGESITVTPDNILVHLSVKNFEKDSDWVKTKVFPYLVHLVSEQKFVGINRVGVVFRHELGFSNKLKEVIKLFTKDKIQSTTDLLIRFSEKLPTLKGLAVDGKNDYRNTIFTLERDSNKLYADFDYQLYFEPKLDDIRNFNEIDFYESSLNALTENFYCWIENFNDKEIDKTTNQYGKQK